MAGPIFTPEQRATLREQFDGMVEQVIANRGTGRGTKQRWGELIVHCRDDGHIEAVCRGCGAVRGWNRSRYGAPLDCRTPGCQSAMTWHRARLHWVITGGESGHGARPMHPDWARKVRDDCKAAGVPFHFKQWGEWAPLGAVNADRYNCWTLKEGKVIGGPLDGKVFPVGYFEDKTELIRVGKKAAGRTLDGVVYDGYPAAMEEKTHA